MSRRLRAQDSRIGLGALDPQLIVALTRPPASAETSFARFRPELPFCSSEERSVPMQIIQNRRTFLVGLSAAGGAGFLKVRPSNADEPPPETTTVRLGRWNNAAYCWGAVYLAGELMRADGLTDVRYVEVDHTVDNSQWLARGDTDFDMNMPSMHISLIEAGVPIKILTGVHTGCFELIANDSVQRVTDLRGKRVGVGNIGSHPQILVSLMANYVGLDPANDINWVESRNPIQSFMDNEVDAVLSAMPEPLRLRAKKIGHTVVSNEVDRPWSQYFCCMVAGNADYVNKHPATTKRVLKAILTAADLCASNPELAAQGLIAQGFVPNYDDALGTLRETGHDKWRDYDAQDSIRFYALRMQETGMITSSPQQIIANGTDFRFLKELKRELKT
ncbi:MAG: ABC transporter substrate-binding protein [Mesorhizobium sp.]|nr:MAG: ABC transporter substrate-binding protein [Mesorhizobium sp.]